MGSPDRIRRLKALVLAVPVALLCAAASAAALSVPDESATHRYLEATITLHHRETHNLSKGVAAMEALTAQVKLECPQVLSASPLRENTKEPASARPILDEALLDSALMLDRAAFHGPLVAFSDKVLRLRWSNRSLTRVLHSFAREGVALSDVTPPHLCADFEAWVKSGYSAEPAGTAAFLRRFKAAESITKVRGKTSGVVTTFDEAEYVAAHLKPYEATADHSLAKRALTSRKLGRRVGDALEAFFAVLFGPST